MVIIIPLSYGLPRDMIWIKAYQITNIDIRKWQKKLKQKEEERGPITAHECLDVTALQAALQSEWPLS